MKRIIASLFIVALVASCGPESKNNLAAYYAKERVKEKLKAPSQTDFIKTELVAGREDTCYIVHVVVDAPNSFGVKLRQSYLVALQMRGDSVYWNPTYVVQAGSDPPTYDEVEGMALLNGFTVSIKRK